MKCKKCGKNLVPEEIKSVASPFYGKCINPACDACDNDFKIMFMSDLPVGGNLGNIFAFLGFIHDYLSGKEREDPDTLDFYRRRVMINYLVLLMGYRKIDVDLLEDRHGKDIVLKGKEGLEGLKSQMKELNESIQTLTPSGDKEKILELVKQIREKILSIRDKIVPAHTKIELYICYRAAESWYDGDLRVEKFEGLDTAAKNALENLDKYLD